MRDQDIPTRLITADILSGTIARCLGNDALLWLQYHEAFSGRFFRVDTSSGCVLDFEFASHPPTTLMHGVEPTRNKPTKKKNGQESIIILDSFVRFV